MRQHSEQLPVSGTERASKQGDVALRLSKAEAARRIRRDSEPYLQDQIRTSHLSERNFGHSTGYIAAEEVQDLVSVALAGTVWTADREFNNAA